VGVGYGCAGSKKRGEANVWAPPVGSWDEGEI
jgi:hypothetical protein